MQQKGAGVLVEGGAEDAVEGEGNVGGGKGRAVGKTRAGTQRKGIDEAVGGDGAGPNSGSATQPAMRR